MENKTIANQIFTFANKRVMLCWGLLLGLFTAAYGLEAVKGSRTIVVFAAILLILWVPFIIARVEMKMRPDSSKIKYLSAYGYLLGYVFLLFTMKNILNYCYFFPMFAIIPIYGDKRLSLTTGIGASVAVIVYSVLSKIGGIVSLDLSLQDIEMLVLIMAASSAFSYLSTMELERGNKLRNDALEEENAKQARMANTILTGVESIFASINHLNDKTKKVEDSSNTVKNSMDDIAKATGDVAESVQRQLEMSKEIEGKVRETYNITNEVHEGFEKTIKKARDGRENIGKLADSTKDMQKYSENVEKNMEVLSTKMAEAFNIIELINGIATQTKLLSLNASIEAARAGDMGRGFAVVASEIQSLAQNTSGATAQVHELLTELEEESKKAQSAVNELANRQKAQGELIGESSMSFEEIAGEVDSFSGKVDRQTNLMREVKNSNDTLAQSIDSFSAFTEELLAGAEQSQALSNDNIDGMREVAGLLEDITVDLKKLQER